MGILFDGVAIFGGGIIGGLFGKRFKAQDMSILGYIIMLIGIVGTLQNILIIKNGKLESSNLVIIMLALVIGNFIGNALNLQDRLDVLKKTGDNRFFSALTIGCVFFGIGGLQLTGPIALAVSSDNSQLYLKSLIDLPFAITFGIKYGYGICASSAFVFLSQIIIALTAYFSSSFLDSILISQICATGYIILFFAGLEITYTKSTVKTINLIPSIFLLIIYNIIMNIVR